uniref:Uncharacterized protein n=1 Tax=Rhodnius prolixus TaxID=13249 RepID=T1HSP5_RHOPR
MITLIKLLVLLFLSILGYDTINLFLLKTFTNEARELATVIQNEEPLTSYPPAFVFYSIGNKILIIFLTSIAAAVVLILLFKKRHRYEGTRIEQIVSQLKNLNESTKNVDLSINCDNEEIIEEEANYESDNDNNLIDETQSAPSSRNSQDDSKSSEESESDQSQQRNKFLVTKPISTTPVFAMPYTDTVNLFENGTPIEEQKSELSNETQRNYYFSYRLNEPRQLFFKDSLQMKNLFPEADNGILRNCECNIDKFQERLEEVECNLRTTKEVTILWRNRIEQTEEELLELQQQIHAIVLEKTFSKLSYLEENKRNKKELEDYPFIFPNLGSFKSLQSISDIIEETKKQASLLTMTIPKHLTMSAERLRVLLRDSERHKVEEEEEQEGEKPFTRIEASVDETPVNSQDVSYCSTISSEADLRIKEQISDSCNQNNITPVEVTELTVYWRKEGFSLYSAITVRCTLLQTDIVQWWGCGNVVQACGD